MRNRRRLTAILTAACVAAAPFTGSLMRVSASSETAAEAEAQTQAAGDTEYETVEINSMEDFEELVEGCHVDTWSAGKYVILNVDLDFGGEEFEPIELFGGIFDGQGHTLSGIAITGYADETGVFGTIAEGGMVANLNVEGAIEPTGYQDILGGIVGNNYGTVSNCSFSGDITADSEVGGIAAYNAQSGIIIGCSTSGSILANSGVGGIVGYNEGTISSCVNGMEINTAYQDTSTSLDEISETLDTILQSGTIINTGELSDDSDIGGIAGFSSGVITSCTNQATVGYEHVGYNVGGIVGRSSGYVSGCTNYGQVYGRKDVGGIAGQMQPYLNVSFTQETLAELEAELDTLGDLVQDLLDDVEGHSDTLSNHLTNINGLVDIAIDAVADLADEAADEVDDAADQLNSAGDRIRTALNIFSAAGTSMEDYLSDLMNSADDVSDALSDYFGGISSSIGELLDALETAFPLAYELLSSDGSSLSEEDVEEQMERLQELLDRLENAGDTEGSGDEDASDGEEEDDGLTDDDAEDDDASGDDGTDDGGAADDGVTEDGDAPDDGAAEDDGTADDGAANGDAPDDGTSDDDAGDDGAAEDDGTADDAGDDGASDDSTPDGGVTEDDAPDDGTTDDDAGDDGAAEDDGTADDGGANGDTPEDGTSDDGSADSGTTGDSGTSDEGTEDTGTAGDASGNGSAEDGAGTAMETSVLPMRASSAADTMVVQTAVTYSTGWRLVADNGDDDTADDDLPDDSADDGTVEEDGSDTDSDSGEGNDDAGTEEDTGDGSEDTSVGEHVSDLFSSLEDYLDSRESLQEEQEELESLTEETEETGVIDTEGLSDALSGMESYLTDMQDSLEEIQDAAGLLSESMDLDALEESVSDALDVLNDAPGTLSSISTAMDVLASIDLQLNGVSGTMRANGEILYSALSQLMDEMENLNQDMSDSVSGTKQDLSAIASQFDRVMDVLVDSAERLLGIEEDEDESDAEEDEEGASDGGDDGDEEDVIEDISDEDIENTFQGRTTGCVNYGDVNADIDVGGIVGMVDVEYSLDPEMDIDSSGSTTLNYVFQAKCIVDDCENRGNITTRSNYAGGIAGRMEMGLITGSANYGTLECDGNYIGGVAGYSAGTVRYSTAKCDISGGRYVGGIAGYGTTLLGNLSMVNVLEYEQYIGAIAGYAADVNAEDISGNYYYAVSLYGIDGVSYTGMAEGVSYAELLEMDGIPEEFDDLVLTFRTDDGIIGVLTLDYGESVPEEELPEIPEKEGFYGVWSRTDYSSIISDETITAEYIRYVTLLSADVKRESGLTAIQVDGSFRTEDALTLTAEAAEDVELERWTLTIPDDGAEVHQVRYLLPDGEDDTVVHVYLIEDGVKREIETSSFSDYITFEVEGNEVTFAVDNILSENGQRKVWIIVTAAGAVLLLIVIVLIVKRRRRSHGTAGAL